MRLRKGSKVGIHRRALLRGAGVTMALPWLPSLASMTPTARAALPPGAIGSLTTDGHPKRLAVLFMGNGINGHHWWAKGDGRRPDGAGQERAAAGAVQGRS